MDHLNDPASGSVDQAGAQTKCSAAVAQRPAKPDAATRLFDRLATEGAAYAKRVGGGDSTALNHQLGALQGHLRGLMSKLAEYEGTGQKPQAGCAFATVSLGDASVLVEYEYEPGEAPNFDVESRGCGPGCDESATVIQMLVNGVWINPEDAVPPEQIERWQQEILDGEAESHKRMKDDADCAKWEARQEQLMEEGYP